MNYKQIFVFSLLSIFLFTGCFEVVEEIRFNEDGSGNATFTLNLSRSKTKLASVMLLDSVNGRKVPSKLEIRKAIDKAVKKIQKTTGISNVKSTLNFDEFIVSVSCDFKDVDALNDVLVTFSSKNDALAIKKQKHFSFQKETKTFKSSHHLNFSSAFNKAKPKDQEVFKTATYTSIYRFNTPILTSKNNTAKISKSRKAIMLRLNALDIITNNQTIKNSIQLEN